MPSPQCLIVDSPEAVESVRGLFPDFVAVRYCNGTLAEQPEEDDIIIFGAEPWNRGTAEQCELATRLRIGAGSILEIDRDKPLEWLRDRIQEYKRSAPGPETVRSRGSPIAADMAPDAEHHDAPDYGDEPLDDAAESLLASIRNASALKREDHAREPAEWPDPVDFWSASPLPKFEERWILPTIRPFVLNQAAMVGCDPGITYLQAIVFAAGCLSDDIRVRVRPLQDWAESARIWACIVGDSGDGKSPSMRGIMRESRDLSIEIAERSKQKQAAYKDEFDLYELDRRDWLSKRQKMDPQKPAGPRPVAPPKPVNEMLYFNDTTSEGLNDQQEATTRGAMCYADEFLGWLLGMDQYKAGGKGSDRQFWLSSWDGAEYVGIRAGKLRTIPNTGVTIIGGSQPSALRAATLKLNLDSDGLLQRVLVYNSSGDAIEGGEQPADRDAIKRWRDILHGLYAMKTHLDYCVFTENAHAIRRDANDWIAAMRGSPSVPVAARQALSKWKAYLPRLALTLHAIAAADAGLEVIPAAIEDHTTASAWEYMRECLWPHLLHFYNTLSDNADDRQHLVAFANYVLARDLTEVRPAYLSSKWTHYQRKVRTIQQRREFWDSVVQAGWARPSGGFDRTGQIAAVYEINPDAHKRFASEAKAAKAQIERYRDIMHPDFKQRREPGEDG